VEQQRRKQQSRQPREANGFAFVPIRAASGQHVELSVDTSTNGALTTK
jgi:hypothetical protein